MSGWGHNRGATCRETARSELTCLRRQVHTIQIQQQGANTGRISKRTPCIRLAPWKEYTKQHRTCQLQHGSTANVSTITSTDVFNTPDRPMDFTTSCQTSLWVVQLHVIYCLNRYSVLSFGWSELSHAFGSVFKKMLFCNLFSCSAFMRKKYKLNFLN